MNEKITLIVPIYNSENWLIRCIESIINQTYKNLEILLIDDGSTDNSLRICKNYSQRDERIKVISKENGGVSSARNIGLEKSTGEYIVFVDSDDWIDKNFCMNMYNTIIKEHVDLVLCGLNIYSNDKILRKPNIGNIKLNFTKIEDYILARKINCGPCNKLFRKKFITNKFNDNLKCGEDLVFNINYLNEINEGFAVEKSLYNVSLDNKNSLNRKINYNKIVGNLFASKEELKFLQKKYNDSKIINEFSKKMLENFLTQLIMYQKSNNKFEFINCCNKLINNQEIYEILKGGKNTKFYLKIVFYNFINKNFNFLYFYCSFLNFIKNLKYLKK